MATVPQDVQVEYPTSDGRPLAETDLHRDLMFDAINTLRDHFAKRPDVYVSGNLMVYYEKGKPRRFRSPDVFVVFGIEKMERDLYKVWEEGKFPDWVLEITSKTTREEDQDEKLSIYRDVWRVKEYFLFDPREEWLEPSLQGFRLVDGNYREIPIVRGAVRSEVLNVILAREGYHLIFRDGVTGEQLLQRDADTVRRERSVRELLQVQLDYEHEARKRAEAEAAEKKKLLEQSDAEIARLRNELEQLRQPPRAEGS